MRLGSGAFEGAYSYRSRMEDSEPGTNPEELIAAAHASCFTMALSFALAGAGHNEGNLETEAKVKLDQDGAGFKVSRSDLKLNASVPGIDALMVGTSDLSAAMGIAGATIAPSTLSLISTMFPIARQRSVAIGSRIVSRFVESKPKCSRPWCALASPAAAQNQPIPVPADGSRSTSVIAGRAGSSGTCSSGA